MTQVYEHTGVLFVRPVVEQVSMLHFLFVYVRISNFKFWQPGKNLDNYKPFQVILVHSGSSVLPPVSHQINLPGKAELRVEDF